MHENGLVHENAENGGASVTTTSTSASQSGGNSNGGGGAAVTTTTSTTGSAATDYVNHDANDTAAMARNVNSHLDTFFRRRAMTREDVLVLASMAQVGLWLVLLYLEVSE
jgi:hypothetical protein